MSHLIPEGARAPDETTISTSAISIKEIAAHCNAFKGADKKRSVFQLATTSSLFFGMCALMFYTMQFSYALTLLLSVPAAGLLTRLFIFQHDCGHGSFFNSKKANDIVGRFLGLLTVTPYDFWRRAHNMHHATSGNLDRRSIGGLDTITVREYQALPGWQKILYRIYRHPLVLLVFGTPFYVMVLQRVPIKQSTSFHENYQTLRPSSIWKSIILTDIAIVLAFGAVAMITGLVPLLMVYIPILTVTAWIGGWLFFIQHQFEETFWARQSEWNIQEAALMGSSYYALPKVLQWFTGNIGLHHIHHLCSKIPNYKLQECMDARPELQTINRLTLKDSLRCLPLKLWDEELDQLVTFREAAAKLQTA